MGDSSGGGIGKFILGVVAGAALSYGYVRWGVELPAFLQLPGQVRDNIVATAVDDRLYDLSLPLDERVRALEVLFQSQPKLAVQIDTETGHPFLEALYRRRAAREARRLRAAWSAFDEALDKPALRQALERKHGTGDRLVLKQEMLLEQMEKATFLKAYLARQPSALGRDKLLDKLVELSRLPAPAAGGQPSAR